MKAQRPVVTNDPFALNTIYIYNESRTLEEVFPIDPKIEQTMGDEFKMFFYAHMDGTVLMIDDVAPWQDW